MKKKLEVWTRSYNPLILGGDVYGKVKCKMNVEGPYDIGKGFKAYLVEDKDGNTKVAEEISGGIIGPDLETVRKDVAEGEKNVMQAQVKSGRQEREKAKTITIKEMKEVIASIG